MAIGRHWEWRGFGEISDRLRERFQELPLAYPSSDPWGVVDDEYLWVPGCNINVKLRTGIEDGLKFKHLERVEGDVELWVENPEELYPYAKLDASTMKALADALQIELPSISPGSFDRQRALDVLTRSRPAPKVVKVGKRRQTRLLEVSGASLKMEIAEISSPVTIASAGIETADLAEDSSPADISAARQSVLSAIDHMGLRYESLRVMSYLEALEVWANRQKPLSP